MECRRNASVLECAQRRNERRWTQALAGRIPPPLQRHALLQFLLPLGNLNWVDVVVGGDLVVYVRSVGLKKQSSAYNTQTEARNATPLSFHLHQNFPNPFNPETRIRFDLPEASEVELRIYNTLGQLVRTLVDRPYTAGSYAVTFDSRGEDGRLLPSGIYFYRIKAANFQAEKKLLLLK